jgi:carboxymethylenebutenolidase
MSENKSVLGKTQIRTQTMMEELKENIRQEVFYLYDDYAHSRIDRREFAKLSVYAVGGLTVPSLMSFLMPDYERAELNKLMILS